jgi:hypothetical protein
LLLMLVLLMLLTFLLLVWEKVGLAVLLSLMLLLEKDGCLEAGVGVIGCLDGRGEAALAVPRVGGGLWEAFLLRNERRRMKRGLMCVLARFHCDDQQGTTYPIEDSLRLDTGGPSLFLSIPTRCEFVCVC